MARAEITNNELNALDKDINQWMQASAAFRFLFQEKIKRFYQQNAMSLKILNKFLQDNVKKYVLHDEAGAPQTEDKEGVKHYKLATPEDEVAYIAAATEFMNRSIYVEL